MLPNSFPFLGFLASCVVLYYVLPHRFRWPLLLLASYYFYASFQPTHVLLLLGLTAVTYVIGLLIGRTPEQRKGPVALGVILLAGTLAFFKYYDFLVAELEYVFGSLEWATGFTLPTLGLPLPVGLSFYAFSAISYLVDVNRGKMETESHFGQLAVFLAFFPKILAGPIERATNFIPQLKELVQFSRQNFIEGTQLILWGLFKKAVIADRIAAFVDPAFQSPQFSSALALIIASYLYAFQIYCDFSGYTDIARGAGKLFGFDLLENFIRPYLSRSTPEFWGRRWHYTLGSWFRDYVYIPLGGSRVSIPHWYFNLMMIFVVSGMWHAGLGYGVNWSFMIWGALNGVYQWIAVGTAPLWRKIGEVMPRLRDSGILTVLRILLTFHLITFAWIFFRASSISDALTVITRIRDTYQYIPFAIQTYDFTTEFWIAIGAIVALIVVEILDERRSVWERLASAPVAVRWASYIVLVVVLLVLGMWGAQEFIYMQF